MAHGKKEELIEKRVEGKNERSGGSGSRVSHRRKQRLLRQTPEVKELREVLTGGILVVQVPQYPRLTHHSEEPLTSVETLRVWL